MTQMARLAIDLALDAQPDLEWYNATSLRTMLRWRSERWRDVKPKSDVIALLGQCLFDAASIQSAIASTDPVAREALALLKRQGGAMPLAAMIGQIAVWHPDLDAARLRAVPSDLVRRALAFWHNPSPHYSRVAVHDVQRPSSDNIHSVVIYSPSRILDRCETPWGLGALTLSPVTGERVGTQVSPSVWQGKVLGFLRAIETRSPKILQSGGIGSRDREALAQAVGLGHDVPGAPRLSAASFYRTTLEAAGLLEVTGDRQLRTTPDASGFVALPPARQARALLDAWLASGENELLALGHLRCERHANLPRVVPDPEQPHRAHRRLVDRLRSEAQPGQWYRVDDVSRIMRYEDVEFLVSWLDPSPNRWNGYHYFDDRDHLKFPPYPGVTLEDSRGRPRSLDLGSDWDLVEGAFVRAVFHGPLTWLGLVECRTKPDGTDVFAISWLGAQVLELSGSVAGPSLAEIPSHRDALIVQPNFEVVVYDPDARPDLLYHIDRFAERVSRDRLAIFRLTNESVSAGLQLGLRIDDVIEVLEVTARAPIPQNVAFSLRDWARRFESVHWYRNAWLIEAPDEATLDRWLGDARVARAVERRLSPTVGLCVGERPPELAAYLRALGSEVRAIDANAPLSPTGWVEGDVVVAIPNADASFYLRRTLGEFAELASESGRVCRYRITDRSIARAVETGLMPARILEVIDRVISGTIPGGMRVRIKGWGGGYAAVALGQVGILVAPNADALHDLRADPAFAGAFILTVSPTAAIVDQGALARLRDALTERGIAIEGYDAETTRLL
ncbi:MAG: helicase-associated domain-containing protein [Chloroflexota bacterium]